MSNDRITPDMTVGEIVKRYPQTVQVFARRSMNCFGCKISGFHNLTWITQNYDVDLETLLAELNASIDRETLGPKGSAPGASPD